VALLRRKRTELEPLREDEVYARSYGDRSDDVTNVKPVPPVERLEEEPKLTDRKIRDAFLSRLDRRDPS
jgi:hypothetical protein